MHGPLNVKFMYNFFSEALSTHKEFSEILHVQARICVKQNDKLFLPELNHNSIRWANFSKNPQMHYPSSSRRVVPCRQPDATTLVECVCILCIFETVQYKKMLITSHYMRNILNNANKNQMG
jgi:hypothetical protein